MAIYLAPKCEWTKDGRKYFYKTSYTLFGEKKIKKSKKFLLIKEAENEERKFLNEIDHINKIGLMKNELINPYDITFEMLFNDFFSQKRKKGSTDYTHWGRLHAHALPFFKDMKITEINDRVIEKWREYLMSKRKRNGCDYNNNYRNSVLSSLIVIFGYAKKKSWIAEIPTIEKFYDPDEIKLEQVIKYQTEDEFKIFMNCLKSKYDNPVYYCFFAFLYFMGTRKGEATALNWNDIHFESGKVDIFKTISNKNFDGSKTVTSTKNKKNRSIYMPDQLNFLLQKLKHYYQEFSGFSDDWYVFGGINSLPFTQIDRVKDSVYDSCPNLNRLTVHQFGRHTHASYLISHGKSISEIAFRLGDTEKVIEDTYIHLFDQRKKEVLDVFKDFKF